MLEPRETVQMKNVFPLKILLVRRFQEFLSLTAYGADEDANQTTCRLCNAERVFEIIYTFKTDRL